MEKEGTSEVFNPHARMRELDAQFDEEEITFEDWKAFITLNYPFYLVDKTIMRMLRELYDEINVRSN